MAGWPEGEVREVERTSYVDGLLRTERAVEVKPDLLEDPDVKLAFELHRSDPSVGSEGDLAEVTGDGYTRADTGDLPAVVSLGGPAVGADDPSFDQSFELPDEVDEQLPADDDEAPADEAPAPKRSRARKTS